MNRTARTTLYVGVLTFWHS